MPEILLNKTSLNKPICVKSSELLSQAVNSPKLLLNFLISLLKSQISLIVQVIHSNQKFALLPEDHYYKMIHGIFFKMVSLSLQIPNPILQTILIQMMTLKSLNRLKKNQKKLKISLMMEKSVLIQVKLCKKMQEKSNKPLMKKQKEKIKKKPNVLLKLKMKTKLVLPLITPLVALLSILFINQNYGISCKE